jgi:8-oxo-dGTP pyrophosphatase MutT (NUDIX family)
MKKEISAGFVVFRKENEKILFLLLQNSSKKFWDFPKGNIDEKESEAEAAKRELKEEAGIEEITIVKGFKKEMKYFYRWKGELIDKKVVMFLGEVESPKIKLSWEHSAYDWLPFDEAKKLLKNQKLEMLEKANDFLSSRLDKFF